MAYTNFRGLVGAVKPGLNSGSTQDLMGLLPDGVGLISVALDLPEERGPGRLEAGRRGYEEKIGVLAKRKVDYVQTEGSALFMMPGVKGEREMLAGWEKKYGIPVVSQGMSLRAAMKAMKFKKVIVVRPYTWKNGADFTGRYLQQAGFDILTVASPEGYDVNTAYDIPPTAVYQCCKKALLAHPGADGLCIVAAVMRVGGILQTIEDDLGIPVVSGLTVRAWEVQKRLHIREPRTGFGRLLRDLP